ncbi:unnamed protein product [Spodoptera littoralis]|uniref:Uncharacterized protein n=1 Tax=Spodoptera littoralis TaxID=7109 RepID=A0A9P0IAG5_SPOLI|nr:unnamed protein product [Spodoptera littoralis]CAH1642659.1 unnamed protein product [Spodoptera littoralis]
MNFESNNITYRNNPRRAISVTDLSDVVNNSEKTMLDATMMSVPDSFLHDTIDETSELTSEIILLKQQLFSAHQEIDNLNIENLRLKTDLQNMITTCNAYKKICSTPEKKRKAQFVTKPRQINSPSDLKNQARSTDT